MPTSPPRVCAKCKRIHKGKCPTRQDKAGRVFRDDLKLSSRPWKRLKQQVRQDQGGFCAHPGCDNLVEQVDHIIPRHVRPDLILERSNLQGLCGPHHLEKTIRENGG